MQNLIFILSLLFIQITLGQVIFVVEAPKNNLENELIYISGDFEGWTGGQEKHRLARKGDSYFITILKIDNIGRGWKANRNKK